MDNIIISSMIGLLLTISEILPYIKQIESNGIIELIINNLTRKSKTANIQSIQGIQGQQETQQLLENQTNSNYETFLHQEESVPFSSNLNYNINKQDDNIININSENVLLKFNTSNIQISFDVNDKTDDKTDDKSDNLDNSDVNNLDVNNLDVNN